MDVARSMTCSGCRQRSVAKARTKGAGIICPSCRNDNDLPLSNDEQRIQPHQGLRSRVRSIGSHIKSKMHHGAVITPSLNHESSGPRPMRSRKRAVLCGITYNNWKQFKLKGTVNDVRNMRELLITRFGYPREYIRVLTEEETDGRFMPTRKNIEDSLNWLVTDCQQGDSLVFFYSGHGSRQLEINNDKIDGLDEIIIPVDFKKSGKIVGNDLNSLIVRPLNPGVTLHVIVDACHSGTILNLPHLYFSLEKKWKSNIPPSGVVKNTNGGLAVCISACLDEQAAVDTSVFTGQMNGALTYLLAEVLKKIPGPTYGDIFDLIHETFDQVNTRNLMRIFDYRLSQTPLLSSSSEFDVYKKHLFF